MSLPFVSRPKIGQAYLLHRTRGLVDTCQESLEHTILVYADDVKHRDPIFASDHAQIWHFRVTAADGAVYSVLVMEEVRKPSAHTRSGRYRITRVAQDNHMPVVIRPPDFAERMAARRAVRLTQGA